MTQCWSVVVGHQFRFFCLCFDTMSFIHLHYSRVIIRKINVHHSSCVEANMFCVCDVWINKCTFVCWHSVINRNRTYLVVSHFCFLFWNHNWKSFVFILLPFSNPFSNNFDWQSSIFILFSFRILFINLFDVISFCAVLLNYPYSSNNSIYKEKQTNVTQKTNVRNIKWLLELCVARLWNRKPTELIFF